LQHTILQNDMMFLLLLFILPTVVVWGRLLAPVEEESSSLLSNNNNDATTSSAFVRMEQEETVLGPPPPPASYTEPPFVFENPSAPYRIFGGNGCPGGSAEVIIPYPPDPNDGTTAVAVLFSQYLAQTNEDVLTSTMSCTMDWPVRVQPGRSVGIFQVDYRGYAYVPPPPSVPSDLGRGRGRGRGGRRGFYNQSSPVSFARFDSEYTFAERRGPKKTRTYGGRGGSADPAGGFDGVFFETDSVGEDIGWSACGGTTTFRVSTSISAYKPRSWDEDVLIALDSSDIDIEDGFFNFTFVARDC
jgi:Domain of unknown function (DUF4360)